MDRRAVASLAEFRELRAEGDGVLVISDFTRKARTMHDWSCKHVTEESFVTKVVRNGGRNGRYEQFEDLAHAQTVTGTRPCGRCVRRLLAS